LIRTLVATQAPNTPGTRRPARAAAFAGTGDAFAPGNFRTRVQRTSDDGILTVAAGQNGFNVEFDTQVSAGSAR